MNQPDTPGALENLGSFYKAAPIAEQSKLRVVNNDREVNFGVDASVDVSLEPPGLPGETASPNARELLSQLSDYYATIDLKDSTQVRMDKKSNRRLGQQGHERSNDSGEQREVIASRPLGVAVDVVVMTVRDRKLQVLLAEHPVGGLGLPESFLTRAESAEEVAQRRLGAATGQGQAYIEHLGALTDPARYREDWIPALGYLALVAPSIEPAEHEPATHWADARALPSLVLDHQEIVRQALDLVTQKLWWSNIAVGILPGAFTMTQARKVYEAITGVSCHPSGFARDLRATGLIEATGEHTTSTGGPPAALYRFVPREPEWSRRFRERGHHQRTTS